MRLSSLGDVVLTTGPMRYLNRQYGWKFAVLTKKSFAPVFDNNPHVVEFIVPQAEELNFPSNIGFFRRVAAAHQGWGLLDLHGSLRSRMLSFFWKGTRRSYPKFSNERRAFLKNRSPEISEILKAASVTQRYMLAIKDVPLPREELLPEVFITDSEREEAMRKLQALQSSPGGTVQTVPQAPLVALHPYATHELKTWPAEYWLKLVELLERNGLPWVVVGQGEPLFPGNPRDLTNKTSLRELAALLGEASVLVTGDSGPMHLASAVGTPVLAMFGPTTAEWGFFPAGPSDRVLECQLPCRPCSLHGSGGKGAGQCGGACMASIKPEEVMAALLEQLARPVV